MELSSKIPSPATWLKIYCGLVGFAVFGTLLSKFAHLDPGPIKPISSILILLSGVLALQNPFGLKQMLAVLVGGAAVEALGIFTGFPFGPYAYSTEWKPVVSLAGHPYPLVLPFAWLMTMLAARSCFPFKSATFQTGLIGLFADAIMEPTMTQRLKYWTWFPTKPELQHTVKDLPPISNAIAWFVLSLVAGAILSTEKRLPAENVQAGRIVLGLHVGFSLFLLVLG